MEKVVVFGPWCGEFSYELSWWNPGIRKFRNEDYKDYRAVHVGYKGRRAMYKDFIDDYVSYPVELGQTLNYPAAGGQHVIDVGEVIHTTLLFPTHTDVSLPLTINVHIMLKLD